MSNHFNNLRKEALYEEGLDKGLALGLNCEALDHFAYHYAMKHFNKARAILKKSHEKSGIKSKFI